MLRRSGCIVLGWLGWEPPVVLNGLSGAVKFVAPLLFGDCLDAYAPTLPVAISELV